MVTYLSFLEKELRWKRRQVGATIKDACLIICDSATQHNATKFESLKREWCERHNAVIFQQLVVFPRHFSQCHINLECPKLKTKQCETIILRYLSCPRLGDPEWQFRGMLCTGRIWCTRKPLRRFPPIYSRIVCSVCSSEDWLDIQLPTAQRSRQTQYERSGFVADKAACLI